MSIFADLVIAYAALMVTVFMPSMLALRRARAVSRQRPIVTRPRPPKIQHHAKSGKVYHDPPMTPLDEAIMDTSRSLWEVVQLAEAEVTGQNVPGQNPDLCGSANPSGSRLCALPPGHYPELHQWNRLPASQGPKTINEQRADQGFSRYIEGIGYIRAESTEKLKRACEVAIRQHDNQMAQHVTLSSQDVEYIPLGRPGHEVSYAMDLARIHNLEDLGRELEHLRKIIDAMRSRRDDTIWDVEGRTASINEMIASLRIKCADIQERMYELQDSRRRH